jgi:hypothetical protein
LGGAEPLELALLQDAQELGLKVEGQVADLVQEQRATVGQLEASLLPREGAREGPLLVSEELALDERAGEGGAVHPHQGTGLATTAAVKGTGDELLAGGLATGRPAAGADVGGTRTPKPLRYRARCWAASVDRAPASGEDLSTRL